ncbi:MAG: hypothetical protein EOP09_01015 [Proteobacteria bacterium]|nr:MAG: hypothetical protein EOP09_01015 [Pseudomonadota bacterium]
MTPTEAKSPLLKELRELQKKVGLGNRKPAPPIPEEIDDCVREVTLKLWNAGFWVTESSEGGPTEDAVWTGKYTDYTFVRMDSPPDQTVEDTRRAVDKFLLQEGYQHFISRAEYSHWPGSNVDDRGSVEIEFTHNRCLVKPKEPAVIDNSLQEEVQRLKNILEARDIYKRSTSRNARTREKSTMDLDLASESVQKS